MSSVMVVWVLLGMTTSSKLALQSCGLNHKQRRKVRHPVGPVCILLLLPGFPLMSVRWLLFMSPWARWHALLGADYSCTTCHRPGPGRPSMQCQMLALAHLGHVANHVHRDKGCAYLGFGVDDQALDGQGAVGGALGALARCHHHEHRARHIQASKLGPPATVCRAWWAQSAMQSTQECGQQHGMAIYLSIMILFVQKGRGSHAAWQIPVQAKPAAAGRPLTLQGLLPCLGPGLGVPLACQPLVVPLH